MTSSRLTALSLLFALACGDKDVADDSAPADDTAPADDSAEPSGRTFVPSSDQSTTAGASVSFAIEGLQDDVAWRVTLVVAPNLTPGGDGTATFVDADANGAADAGASETVALIESVNGAAITPSKTWPAGDDDPANPSGIFPENGVIELSINGVGPGTVHPVIYVNGGASTFLELDGSGSPVETYTVGPAVTVN